MKTILYLGTDPTQFENEGRAEGHLIHYPIIKIVPRPEAKQTLEQLDAFTHLLFTSKNAVNVFFEMLGEGKDLSSKKAIAIGHVTAAYLQRHGLQPLVAEDETQEGVVELLKTLDLRGACIFLPRSSSSRPVLVQYFEAQRIRYAASDLYDTVTNDLFPRPDLENVDEIVFTSPSTVKAFKEIFKELPKGKKLIAIGPVTKQALTLS